jgi:hypothetical protein
MKKNGLLQTFFYDLRYFHILVFYLKKNRMALRHAPFSECHAPFDKKKCGAMYC